MSSLYTVTVTCFVLLLKMSLCDTCVYSVTFIGIKYFMKWVQIEYKFKCRNMQHLICLG